jgi:hypothetical protein
MSGCEALRVGITRVSIRTAKSKAGVTHHGHTAFEGMFRMLSCCVAGGNILARLDRLEDRANSPLISPTARGNFEAASCVLLDEDKPIGIAFFIAERVCLTCNHNLGRI